MAYNARYNNNAREPFSLKVDDIPGARPKHSIASKKTGHYLEKLDHLSSNPYQNPVYKSNVEDPNGPFQSRNRIIHQHYDSEIQTLGLIKDKDKLPEDLATFDYPRNLATHDIPGAIPGTLISKVVKNHELAHKMRGQEVEEKMRTSQQSGSGGSSQKDVLDAFKRDANNKYIAKGYDNPYDRMSDNFHFRSSQSDHTQLPQERVGLKQKEFRKIYEYNPFQVPSNRSLVALKQNQDFLHNSPGDLYFDQKIKDKELQLIPQNQPSIQNQQPHQTHFQYPSQNQQVQNQNFFQQPTSQNYHNQSQNYHNQSQNYHQSQQQENYHQNPSQSQNYHQSQIEPSPQRQNDYQQDPYAYNPYLGNQSQSNQQPSQQQYSNQNSNQNPTPNQGGISSKSGQNFHNHHVRFSDEIKIHDPDNEYGTQPNEDKYLQQLDAYQKAKEQIEYYQNQLAMLQNNQNKQLLDNKYENEQSGVNNNSSSNQKSYEKMLQGYLDSTVPNSRLSNIETDKESNRNPNQYEYKYNNSHDSYKRQPSTQSLQNQVKASPTSSTSKERLMDPKEYDSYLKRSSAYEMFQKNSQKTPPAKADYSDIVSTNRFKKIYTYNILSNQPIPKLIPSKARLPYGYALGVEADRIDLIQKNDLSQFENQQYPNTHDGKIETEKKQANNQNIFYAGKGAEYGQSMWRYDPKLTKTPSYQQKGYYGPTRNLTNVSEV